MMGMSGNAVKGAVLLLAFLGASACARLDDRHGYIPDAELLADIEVGRDTRQTVDRILGRPGTEGIIDNSGWYYVRSDYERFLWRAPVEVDREVLAISFDEAGPGTRPRCRRWRD